MKYPKYPVVITEDYSAYEFYSEGPVGRIKKMVSYKRIENCLFNLAFGDWNEKFREIDDSSRSNNGDRDKVLATVAFTAIDFTSRNPGAMIFIEGSTPSRTRLYQMGIRCNLLEINEKFKVEGWIEERWEPFRLGRNYESFLVQRK
jgi:hypothetical protein